MAPRSIDRETINAKVKAIRNGAAEISQLLAADTLGGDDDWDRAVRILVGCRQERKQLEDSIRKIDLRRH